VGALSALENDKTRQPHISIQIKLSSHFLFFIFLQLFVEPAIAIEDHLPTPLLTVAHLALCSSL
jgi:hypothetical protein